VTLVRLRQDILRMDVEGSWSVLGRGGGGTAIIMELDANAGRCQTRGDGSLDFRDEQVAVVEGRLSGAGRDSGRIS
jgi:hypothetical protein